LSSGVLIDADAWLAEVMGRPVYRVALVATDSEPTAANGSAELAGPGFYYAKVPARDLAAVHRLAGYGFNVVDVNVVLERVPATVESSTGVTIRDCRDDDREAVLDIAQSCFVYSRFHLDPLVPNDLADAVKREWIRNYVLGARGERLAVAVVDGRPAGFLASLAVESVGQRVRVIDLIGVDSELQGRGIGRALVDEFKTSAVGRFDRLRVGTQVANAPSIRLYEQCGFRFAASSYVLHAHRDE